MRHETNYAYKILSDELRILRKAIKEGNWSNYPEALKDRMIKAKQINEVLKMLDEKQGSFYEGSTYKNAIK